MSNWVGGLPSEPRAQKDKKENKSTGTGPGSPPSDQYGAHPKTFYGGAIPPVPPNLPRYKKEEQLPPEVKITGASSTVIVEPPPEPTKMPVPSSLPKSPKPVKPKSSHPATPVSKPTSRQFNFSPPAPLPKSLDQPVSVIEKKPTTTRKKQKEPFSNPPPSFNPVQICEHDHSDQGEEYLGQVSSIFAISHIPATRQGKGLQDYGCYMEKVDHSSPCNRGEDDEEGPDIPPAIPSHLLPDKFAGIFGKKIDARNLAPP